MSMILGLTQLNDETIERLVADPPLVWLVVAPDEREFYESARQAANRSKKPGILSRLFGATTPSPAPPEGPPFSLGEGEGKETDLDKSWHGIHFLLTGSSEEGSPPLDFLLEGGRYVGDQDVGYGPARVFTSTQVRAIAAAVRAIGDDALAGRFASAAMSANEIYPEIWTQEGREALSYLMAHVATLRDTLESTVGTNRGLMITLS